MRRILTEVGPRYALDTRADANRPLVLEVGCGSGEAALAFAGTHPHSDILAIDVHTPGIGALLRELESSPRSNVFVEHTDAVELIEDLPPESVAGVHVFFPDPWPKARHHKRRFIRTDILDLVADAMTEDAPLRFATDMDDYGDWALKHLEAHPAFAGGVSERPVWRPITRYEQIGLDAGRAITDLTYRRLARE